MIRHVELQTSFFHFPFLEVQWAGVPTLSLLSLVCTRCRWQTSAFIRKDCSVMIRDLSWTWLPFSNSMSPTASPVRLAPRLLRLSLFLQEEKGISCELVDLDFLRCSVGFPFMRAQTKVRKLWCNWQSQNFQNMSKHFNKVRQLHFLCAFL